VDFNGFWSFHGFLATLAQTAKTAETGEEPMEIDANRKRQGYPLGFVISIDFHRFELA